MVENHMVWKVRVEDLKCDKGLANDIHTLLECHSFFKPDCDMLL